MIRFVQRHAGFFAILAGTAAYKLVLPSTSDGWSELAVMLFVGVGAYLLLYKDGVTGVVSKRGVFIERAQLALLVAAIAGAIASGFESEFGPANLIFLVGVTALVALQLGLWTTDALAYLREKRKA